MWLNLFLFNSLTNCPFHAHLLHHFESSFQFTVASLWQFQIWICNNGTSSSLGCGSFGVGDDPRAVSEPNVMMYLILIWPCLSLLADKI